MDEVKLSTFIRQLNLDLIYVPNNISKVFITSQSISRIGLEIIGDIKYFDPKRVLFVGQSEESFLLGKGLVGAEYVQDVILERIDNLISMKPPIIVVANPVKIPDFFLKTVQKYGVTLARSKHNTGRMISEIIDYLKFELAPRIIRSGGFMNIFGEGVLIIGESGVGKSEAELELLKRGHKLISDDTVELRKIYYDSILGQSPSGFGQFIEVRGLGIVNVRRLFGVGAVKQSEILSLIVGLELWQDGAYVERLETTKFSSVLDVKIPYIKIPIKPGRNTAVLIEVAAMNNRQKNLGYNATKDLCNNLNIEYFEKPVEQVDCNL